MKSRLVLALTLSSALLAGCGGSSDGPSGGTTAPPPTTDTSVMSANFNPSTGSVPSPINFAFLGSTDLTLNITVANPNNFADPSVSLNALDGFSTVAPWSAGFSRPINASSVVPGSTVRLFQVNLNANRSQVTSVVRELAAGTEFVTTLSPNDATGRTLVILPLRPLAQASTYMAVVTNGVRDTSGIAASAEQAYFLAKRTAPLCVNGATTDPLVPTATACALEPVRVLVSSQEAAAAAAGVNRDNIVVSWVATTQSITPVLQAVRQGVQGTTPLIAPTGQTSAAVGLPPVADIYVGGITLPYYLEAPSAGNPTAAITTRWRAAPGAYVAPYNQLGLDPTSTNLTFANPVPVKTADVTAPMIITVPNANSGRTRPANGWPVVIFTHGITRNRTDALALSATFAAQGYAVVAIDQPLHGITPADTSLAPFYVGTGTPLYTLGVRERTFYVDYVNNTTGAAGPDGNQDSSGTHFINLSSLLTSRDNLRQSIADLFVVRASIGNMNYDGVPGGDFDASNVAFIGQSLGGIVGTGFVALEPNVSRSVLNVPGGGIAQLLNNSVSFGPRIRAGLAASGVTFPSTDFDRFMVAAQTAVDSADPLNLAFAAAGDRILLQEVVGGLDLGGGVTNPPDQVVPNAAATAPLAGTEPLIRALGLSTLTATTSNAGGVRGVVRFTKGEHGSLLSPARSIAPAAPTGFLDVTTEMQGEAASFIVSGGTTVQIANPAVIRGN